MTTLLHLAIALIASIQGRYEGCANVTSSINSSNFPRIGKVVVGNATASFQLLRLKTMQTFKIPARALAGAKQKFATKGFILDPTSDDLTNIKPLPQHEGFVFTMEFSKWLRANLHHVTVKPFGTGLAIQISNSDVLDDFQKNWG